MWSEVCDSLRALFHRCATQCQYVQYIWCNAGSHALRLHDITMIDLVAAVVPHGGGGRGWGGRGGGSGQGGCSLTQCELQWCLSCSFATSTRSFKHSKDVMVQQSGALTHHNSRLGLHEVEHLAHINDGLLSFPVHCAQEVQRHRQLHNKSVVSGKQSFGCAHRVVKQASMRG